MSKRFRSLPNALSLYRIAAAPVIAVCLVRGLDHWFAWLLAVSLVSDIADGWIARRFKLQTEFGARLDSFADLLTFLLALCGVVRFKWAVISQPQYAAVLSIFVGLYALLMLTGFLKFRRQPSLHLYSFKIAAYLQGACILVVFLWGFHPGFYYFTLAWGSLACLEEIAVLLLLTEPRSDVKGLYWVLKERLVAR